MAQTPGSESDKGRKYELSVVAFIASSLSQNENVVDYRIYSNLTKYYPFDDVVVEVDFKGSKGSQIYAIQTKSGNYKFDFWKYVYGYGTIIGEVQEDKLQVWHFAAKNMEYFQQQLSKTKQSTCFGCKECSNTDSKDILRETRYYKLHPKNSDLAQHTNFFRNFYLFFDQPDTQKADDSLHLYIEKYFTNINNCLDKKSFEHELLRNRLYNYVVIPTKAIRFQHKAVDEWNRLTLTRDVTVVLNEKHTEEYLYGCMLQNKNISNIINIDQWNRFVENEGKLDDIVKNYFKNKPYKVETLKDLIFQRWVDGKIPLILRTDASLPVLKEFQHLNKKYIIIVSDITNRSVEIEHYGLKVFKHLGDVDADKMMKNIPVSLQGREPTSLYEIVNEGEALKKAVTCLDVLNLIKPRKAYVNRKCLNGNDHMLFIIETENLPQRSLDEEQPSGTNIEIYCEPNQGCERYSEIRADPRYKSYKTFHLRSTDDNKLTLISKTDSRGITQKGGGHRGLECFFVDENDENIYYMDNGDVIPIIGEVPIRSCWRYVPCHLRDVVKKNTPISIDGSTSNKISIEYGEHLLTEREFFSEDNGKMVIVTGEPGMATNIPDCGMVEQASGIKSDGERKYELIVTAFVASLFSKYENVENYTIFNFAETQQFSNIEAEVTFKNKERRVSYVIQIKSGKHKLDINEYYDECNAIIKTKKTDIKPDNGVRNECIYFWYFYYGNPNNDLTFPLKTEKMTIDRRRCKSSYNTHESIFGEIDVYKLYSNAVQTTAYQNFLDSVYLSSDVLDTPNIIGRIQTMWNVDPLQMIMFLDYHFDNTKALDKATFEHELLKIRLSDYIVTPTKVIPFTHKAVKEWNRLTLDRDVTIVSGKPNVERYLFGCILQNITDLNIDKWNSFVENEGKLNSDVKRQLLAQTNFVVETLKDLLILLWAKKKIPLILKTDAWLPVLREFSHLKRKYIIIDSNVKKRFAEIKNYGLTVFSHLGDIETETLMKNIPVSLQGREPTSLYEIINGDKALKEAVSCFDVMNLTRPRAPCVNRECLDETENPQCHNHEQQHGEQLVRSNIVMLLPTDYYCYLRFENRESSTDDERLTAISTKNEHCTIEKDEGRCGLNCFLVDQNGDVIPIIGQVPIYRHYRPAYRQLRKGSITVKQSSISINKYASNKFSISYSKHLITARALFEKAINEITVVAGEPEMGKTTLLQSLFLLCESKYYVIFIDLAQHRDNFCNDKLKSFQDFIRLSCNECLSLPYSDFLQKLHDYPERLVVMLDSFDERLATYEKQVLEFIKNLEQLNLHKIIIASRLTAVNRLINHFEIDLFKLVPSSKKKPRYI